jgi:hypothetical protein
VRCVRLEGAFQTTNAPLVIGGPSIREGSLGRYELGGASQLKSAATLVRVECVSKPEGHTPEKKREPRSAFRRVELLTKLGGLRPVKTHTQDPTEEVCLVPNGPCVLVSTHPFTRSGEVCFKVGATAPALPAQLHAVD